MAKTERQKLELKVWDECKRIIRLRYDPTCYTCGSSHLSGSNHQTGHGKPKASLSILYKYDLRNLKPQCMRCNLHMGGATDIFIAKLEKEEEGLQFLQESCYKTDDGFWKVRGESTMGGKDAMIYLQGLLDNYKKIVD